IGEAGSIIYPEDGWSLGFSCGIHIEGYRILVPSIYDWDRFCEKSGADCGKGRRTEILERVAGEYCRQKANNAEWKVTADEVIVISFENYRRRQLLKRLRGDL